MEKAHVNIIPNLDEPIQTLPTKNESNPIIEKMTSSNDKENKIPEQSINMNISTITLNPTNDPSLDGTNKIYLIISFNLLFLFRYFRKN
jgi:hypothetical protein